MILKRLKQIANFFGIANVFPNQSLLNLLW